MEGYVHGVSTRKVDDLVRTLGIDAGISKSEVSRICGQLDEQVGAFCDRSLGHSGFPYLFLDATYLKAQWDPTGGPARGEQSRRDRGRRPCRRGTGGPWLGRWRLRGRGLLDGVPSQPALAGPLSSDVQLVISDAHEGLKGAIAAVTIGAVGRGVGSTSCATSSPRCPKGSKEMVAAAIRTIFA